MPRSCFWTNLLSPSAAAADSKWEEGERGVDRRAKANEEEKTLHSRCGREEG